MRTPGTRGVLRPARRGQVGRTFASRLTVRLAVTGLVALLTAPVGGAAATGPRNMRFRRVSVEQGLCQAAVLAILQDRHGFVWLATQEGLNRFDGQRMTCFTSDVDDPESLAHNWIWALHEDRSGTLWIGTDGGGLDRFDARTQSFFHYRAGPAGLSSDRVRAITEGSDGALWIGTDGGGLNRFDPRTEVFRRFVHDPQDPASLASDRVRALVVSADGSVWVGTDGGGLSRLDPETGTFRHYRHDVEDVESLSSDRVRSLFLDRDGALWVGTYDAGLCRLETGDGSVRRLGWASSNRLDERPAPMRAMQRDRDGTLWVGTDQGLTEWVPEEKRFVHYRNDPDEPWSLSHDRVLSIFQDRGGMIWVGTNGGLNIWNPLSQAFRLYQADESGHDALSNDFVTSFADQPDGTLWVGTFGGGLNRLDRAAGTFTHYRHDPGDPRSLGDDRVMALLIDDDQALWVGTYRAGLYRLRRGRQGFDVFRHDPGDPTSLSSDGVTVIFQDSRGGLWVGTYGAGLNRFEPPGESFTRYNQDAGAAATEGNRRILALQEGHDGGLWVGTDGGGLDRLDPASGDLRSFRHDPGNRKSLGSDRIWALFEDAAGVLWIAAHGSGLDRWSAQDRADGRALFRHYTRKNGLPSSVIHGILPGAEGELWLSTSGGLARFVPAEESFKVFDTSHGLQGYEFNFGAAHRAADGLLLFGGVSGFNAFFPGDIRANSTPPPVALTAIQIGDRPPIRGALAAETEAITLTPHDHLVTFDFAALDYAAPEKNRFMHRLEGLDHKWVETGSFGRASYSHPPAGEYLLRVKAANNDGVWNESGIALALKVLPPHWKTWWAYTLYALAILASVALYARSMRRKLAQAHALELANRELEQEIEERKSKEQALERARFRAQRYLDVAEVIMVAVDRSGRVRLMNQKGCRLLGWSENEIVGEDWCERFVPASHRSEVREKLGASDLHEYWEYPVLTRNRRERMIAWHSTLLPEENGNPPVVLSSGADLTEVKELELQLRTSQKLDAIGTLAGGIAHDFNNILTAIIGYTELALRTMAPSDPNGENLRQILSAGHRARDLVRRILAFSRRGEQEARPTRLTQVVEEALELLRSSLPATIEIREELSRDCPPVLADPTQMLQVVMNLCTNAYQAMAESGGLLELSVDTVEVDLRMKKLNPELHPGPHVRLRIRDTGPGMDPATAERIFEPFFTTKGVGAGTGLGLSVVHGIVRHHGGVVLLASAPGQGTTFTVLLPAMKSLPAPEPRREVAPTGGSERILLVDDEAPVVAVASGMLEQLGYRVTATTSSLEALQTFRDRPQDFDLMITDRTMPRMTGAELARRIRQVRPDLPIILATGLGSAGDSDGGFRAYLRKPFTPDEIARTVRQALDR